MSDIKYKQIMMSEFEPAFDRFCVITKASEEQKEKIRQICFQWFEIGALAFADEEKMPFAAALCDVCGYPVFHGEARIANADGKNYHAKCREKV